MKTYMMPRAWIAACLSGGVIVLLLAAHMITARTHAVRVGHLSVDTILPAAIGHSVLTDPTTVPGALDGALIAIGKGFDGQSIWLGAAPAAGRAGAAALSHNVVHLAGIRLHGDAEQHMAAIRGNPTITWRELFCRPVQDDTYQCTALDRDVVVGHPFAAGQFHYFDLAHALVEAGLADATAPLPVIPISHFVPNATMPASSAVTASSEAAAAAISTNDLALAAYIVTIITLCVIVEKFAPRLEQPEFRRAFAYMLFMFVVLFGAAGFTIPGQIAGEGSSGFLLRGAQVVGACGGGFLAIRGIKIAMIVMTCGALLSAGVWLVTGHWL